MQERSERETQGREAREKRKKRVRSLFHVYYTSRYRGTTSVRRHRDIWLLTATQLRTRGPGAPARPLAVLRRRDGLDGVGTGRQIDAHDIVVIVADANAAAERGRRIRAGAPASLHREAAGLGAGGPGRPGGPAAVNGAICYSDTGARASLPAVLGWGVVAFPGLALARVDILRSR